jgi:phage shock protein E
MLTLFSVPTSFAGARETQAWELINQGALVIDVRTDREYVSGHLEDALLIPHQKIVSQLKKLELRKDLQIVVYCRSGQRAGVAERALRDAGYTHIFNGGGFTGLINESP